MPVITSSSPFLDTMINDLAVAAWSQSKGDPNVAAKIYESMLRELVSRTVRQGAQQEGESARATAAEGRSSARLARVEGTHALEMGLKEESRVMFKEVADRAAMLNSLGAAVAAAGKIYMAYESDPGQESFEQWSQGFDQELAGFPKLNEFGAGQPMAESKGITGEQPIPLTEPQLGGTPEIRSFSQQPQASDLVAPEVIPQRPILDRAAEEGRNLAPDLSAPSQGGTAGKGFKDENSIIAEDAEKTAEMMASNSIASLLEGELESMMDNILTFRGESSSKSSTISGLGGVG